VLGIAVVVVVLVVAAVVLAVVLPDDGSVDDERGSDRADGPEAWDERIAPIAEWVEYERELAFEHPVEVRFLSEEEYQEATAGEADGSSEEEVQEAEDTADLLRALGLISGDVDLEAAGADLAGEGTLAFYSPGDEVVYVRGEELTPSVRVTVTHELTHVLQDQHFDLDRLTGDEDDDDDEAAGLRSVAEGDADRIGDEYAGEELSADELEEHEAQAEEDENAGDEGLAEVPPALIALSTAPYTLGQGFVTVLDEESAAIDEALQDPPSEQELLDPAVRGTDRAEPVEVDAPEAPDGAEVVDEDVFGPVAWFLVLAARGAPADALAVVDDWGGDAFVSYREDDRLCVEIAVAGDDADATAAFGRALDAWAARHPGGGATVETAGDAVRLVSCDPGEGADPAGEVGPDVISLPLVRTQIETDLEGNYSATAEEARCASGRILDELSLEELTADEVPPETGERIQALAEECRA
jgi:hypothetical protein